MNDREAIERARAFLAERQRFLALSPKTKALKRVIELAEAHMQVWDPTHLHTQSRKLYMVMYAAPILNVETDVAVEMVLYRDEDGKTFTQSRARFDEILASGEPRFQTLSR